MAAAERKFDRYTIESEIGRGGFAVVYKAFDPRFRRQVAIKVLPPHFLHDPRFRSRFEDEARTIASLEHPSIVPVHDFGEHEGQPFLVMRYMPGGTLRAKMGKQPMALPEVARILAEIAPALDKAHDRGIIHRDIKPDNVLFDEDGRSYLADFGIARLAEATRTMTITGTPAYMSPEQVKGDQTLDGRSDIYALGVMLFELLAGQQPYMADTPTKQMLKHVLEPIPNILNLQPNLPPACQEIVGRAMAKERRDRYRSAQELSAAVSQLTTIANPWEPTVIVPNIAAPPQPSSARPEHPKSKQAAAQIDQQDIRDEKTIQPSDINKPPAVPLASHHPLDAHLAQPVHIVRANSNQSSLPRYFVYVVLIALAGWGIWGLVEQGANLVARATPISTSSLTSISSATAESALTLVAGNERVRARDGATMVYVPAGTFPMGSDAGADSDEVPQHDVTLDGFWIDQHEVTNDRYVRCVNDGNCNISKYVDNGAVNGADYPVVGVSWKDAVDYCHWVGARLPTEAEWEYAARGKDGRLFPWGNNSASCSLANYGGCIGTTMVVGSYPEGVSWVNAFDMAGNVWEWVQDWYDENYYENSPRENPPGPEIGTIKVLRGGSWNLSVQFVRAANRDYYFPSDSSLNVGFRCAQE